MPRVTELKPQKNQKRVNVYLDGKFGFGIDLDNLVKYGIKIEKDYDSQEIEKIVKAAEFQKTLDKLFMFANVRLRSEKEVRDWMKRKKVHESLEKKLLEKLREYSLVDDLKFAYWWIQQRKDFKPRGKRALQFELMKKGIDKKIIETALGDLIDKTDERKMAKDLVTKYSYKWTRYEGNIKWKKQCDFLARKGFSWNTITDVLGNLADE